MNTSIVVVRAQAALYEEFDVTDQGGTIDPDYLSYHLGDSDAAAVAAAVNLGGRTVAVMVGDHGSETALYEALALGASRAVRIDIGRDESDPLIIARLLSLFVSTENADLVLSGATSTDDGDSAVPGAIAGYLGWVQVPHATRIHSSGSDVVVLREVGDGSLEELSVTRPAIISIRQAGPARTLPSFKSTLSAVHQSIDVLAPNDLGLSYAEVNSSSNRLVRLTKRTPLPAVQLTGSSLEVAERIVSIINERTR